MEFTLGAKISIICEIRKKKAPKYFGANIIIAYCGLSQFS